MIRIVGDSHVGILLKHWRPAEGNPDLEFSSYHGVNFLNPKVTEEAESIHLFAHRASKLPPLDYRIEPGHIYIFSAVLHSAPTYRDQAWQTYCPWIVARHNPDLIAVSTRAVETWVERQMKYRFALIELMRARGYNLAVLEPPKPLVRTPKLHMLRPDVLRAADELHRGFVLAWLEKHNVPVIRVPEETHMDGFTTEDYSAPLLTDPHHGNGQFAKLMIHRILEWVAGSQERFVCVGCDKDNSDDVH